jgi:hypothetical protein
MTDDHGAGLFRTPVGVRCGLHRTHALDDEPCWVCEREANDPPTGIVDQQRLHLCNMKLMLADRRVARADG